MSKIIFKRNIILIYFKIKNILKNNTVIFLHKFLKRRVVSEKRKRKTTPMFKSWSPRVVIRLICNLIYAISIIPSPCPSIPRLNPPVKPHLGHGRNILYQRKTNHIPRRQHGVPITWLVDVTLSRLFTLFSCSFFTFVHPPV
jgi:hypothetical protein